MTVAVVAVSCVLAATDPASAGGGCPDLGDTGAVNVDFQNRMSSLVGVDIRTGAALELIVNFEGQSA